MRSLATTRFWRLYNELPEAVRKLADESYQRWQHDSRHPSLHFKKLKGSQELYSIRIGAKYRAIGRVKGESIEWTWIGSHEDYNRLLTRTRQ